MFTTIIVRPIFNLLSLIYAIIPGHNFGLAIIIFTIVIRMLMWPLVKKQMHQAKAMRQLQPEIKRIKKESKGNKQAESKLLIELYSGLRKVVYDPKDLVTFSYPFIQHIGWMKHIAANPVAFKNTLFGLVNLDRAAIAKSGIYWPAMVIVIASAVTQFFQGKQLMPSDKN